MDLLAKYDLAGHSCAVNGEGEEFIGLPLGKLVSLLRDLENQQLEIDILRKTNSGLVDRVAVQSELLSKRAERSCQAPEKV